MKKIGLLMSIIICLQIGIVKSQFKYSVTGTSPRVKNGEMVFLINLTDQLVLDSISYHDGFLFKGESKELLSCVLRDRVGRSLAVFILEPGKISIVGGEREYKSKVYGGKQNQLHNRELKLKTATYDTDNERLVKEVWRLSRNNDPNWKIVNDSVISADKKYRLRLDSFYLKHNDSFWGLNDLWWNRLNIDSKLLNTHLDRLPTQLKKHRLAQNLRDFIDISNASHIKSINQLDTSNRSVTLSFPNTDYVLIDFWASWCIPCRKNNPLVKSIQDKYKGKNLNITSISLDDDMNKWKSAIRDDQMDWNHMSDLRGWKNDYASKQGITSIPTYMLIAPDGKILLKESGGLLEVSKKLKEIFP